MHYSRVKRYIDDVCVREPAYYADPGEPGWYPELQHPNQARLAVRYSPLLEKYVYIQPNSLFFSGLKDGLGKSDLRALLDRFGVERGMEFSLFQPHKSYPSTSMGIMTFPSQRQAEDAMYVLNQNSETLGKVRGEGRNDFRVRYSEINSLGLRQHDISDILLVREDLSITDAYVPTYLGDSNGGFPHRPSSPSRWHAVGYSRDEFSTKRKVQDFETPRKDDGKGGHAAEDSPSPPKRRALEPVKNETSDEKDGWHGTDGAIAFKMRQPLQPIGLGHPSSFHRLAAYQYHFYPGTIDPESGPVRLARSRNSKKKKGGKRSLSPHRRSSATDNPNLFSAPGGNRPMPRGMTLDQTTSNCSELSVLSNDQKKVLAYVLPLLPDLPQGIKGRAVTDTPSQAEKFARSTEAAKQELAQEKKLVASSLSESLSGAAGKEPSPAEVEQKTRLTSWTLSMLQRSILSARPESPVSPGSALKQRDVSDRKGKLHFKSPDSPEAGEIIEASAASAVADTKPSLLDGTAVEALPAKPTFIPRRETLQPSILARFSRQLHPNANVEPYREPRFIALSPDGQTLTLSHSATDTRAFPAKQPDVFPIEKLSDAQRRILGVEKRWVLNGPAWERWKDSREGVVVVDANDEHEVGGDRISL
ncbi:hypothetical protein IAR50_001815 [Cryptococcus sp. DSM 104548]